MIPYITKYVSLSTLGHDVTWWTRNVRSANNYLKVILFPHCWKSHVTAQFYLLIHVINVWAHSMCLKSKQYQR